MPIHLALANVNKDKKPDIIVANQLGHNFGVLVNNGQGMFLPQETYSTALNSHPQHISTGDVNNDGQLDIVVATNGGNGFEVFLKTNNSKFMFQGLYKTGQQSYPASLAVADIDNDKVPDVIIANQNENNIGVLLNPGDGVFTSQRRYQSLAFVSPVSPLVMDINDDNKPDVIFANFDGHSVGVLFNFGNGTLHSLTIYPTGYESKPRFVSVVDVNQDDKLDLVVANSNKSNIGVFLNIGNGTFFPQNMYFTGNNSSPQCVSVVDLTGDSKPEIIFVDYNENNVGILVNIGNGQFILEKTYSTGSDSNPKSVLVADVNDDEKPDIIVANSGTSNVGVMLAA